MKFHFNEVALRHTAQSRLPDREGRLLYRSHKGAYKERWFRLHGNLLFYFRTNDFGAVSDHDPVGVFVLAKVTVEMDQIADRPFVFTVGFEGEEGRKHYFSGQTMQQCRDWIDALQRNSYEAVRMKYELLRREVLRLTGKDLVKEKMALSAKRKPKLETRQTKFYYDSGFDVPDGLVPTKSSSELKPAYPIDVQNAKPTVPLKPDLHMNLGGQKPLLDNALITLSPDDVPKAFAFDSLSNVLPTLQSGVSETVSTSNLKQSSSVQLSAMQQVYVQKPLVESMTTKSLPAAYRQVPLNQDFAITQQGMVGVPFPPVGTGPLGLSGIPRVPNAVISMTSEGHILQQNIARLSSVPSVNAHWAHQAIAPQMSCLQPDQMKQTMTQLDFRQQPPSRVDRMHTNSFSSLPGFPASVETAPQNSSQLTKENSLHEWHALEMGKSQTSPELMSFHKWEKFDH